MRAEENQRISTMWRRTKLFFFVHETVAHVPFIATKSIKLQFIHTNGAFAWERRKVTSVQLCQTVKCFFYVHKTVAHALFYNDHLKWSLTLQFIHTKSAFVWERRKVEAFWLCEGQQNNSSMFFFFFFLSFLSRTVSIHMTAGERGGHLFKTSLPLSPASQILRH